MKKIFRAGGIVLGCILFILLIYWAFYSDIDTGNNITPQKEEAAKNIIKGFKYIRRSQGKTHWMLTASDAKETDKGNFYLRKVHLDFYDLKGDTPIKVVSDEAEYNQEKFVIKLKGNVKISYDELKMSTDILNYADKDGFLFTESDVEITTKESSVYSKGLKAYTEEKKLKLYKVTGDLKLKDLKILKG